MKFASRTTLEVYIEYFKSHLKNFENGDIYSYLCRKVANDLFVIKTGLNYSILAFLNYIYASYITYDIYDKEKTKKEIKKLNEKLAGFMDNGIFPIEIWNSFYFSQVFNDTSDIRQNRSNTFDELLKKANYNTSLSNLDLLLVYYSPKYKPSAKRKVLSFYLSGGLKNIGIYLYKLGILEKLVTISNGKLKYNFLEGLAIKMGNFDEKIYFDPTKPIDIITKPQKDNIESVAEIFSLSYLTSINIFELNMLSCFWANKLAKTIGALFEMLFLFSNNQGMLYQLKEGANIKNIIDYMEDNHIKNDILIQLCKLYNGEKINTLRYSEKNLKCILPIYTTYMKNYYFKYLCFFYALESEGKYKNIKNYGFTCADNASDMLTWTCDLPGYNLPVSLHCKKEQIRYYYTVFRKNSKIRVYIGADDFFSGNNILKNTFLYPIPKSQIEYLKEKGNINNRLAHISFINTGKWPKHLRDKNGKVQKKFITLEELMY